MSREEKSHDKQLLLFARNDVLTFQEMTNGGILVLGEMGSGKTSTISTQLARSIEESTSFGGLITTGPLSEADKEA